MTKKLLILTMLIAGAQPAFPACPGAAAWQTQHPEQSVAAQEHRDQARTLTEPLLRREIQQRAESDQRARVAYLANSANSSLRQTVAGIDVSNLQWLKDQVAKIGIPSAAQVGESGLHLVWLLVQHADQDPQFQANVYPQFVERYKAGELRADDLAKLTDRLLLKTGKTQRYGTQFDWLSGHFEPRNPGDLSMVDARREELGLMSLADYACEVNEKLEH